MDCTDKIYVKPDCISIIYTGVTSSGTSGTSGTSGSSGTSGTSGIDGINGSSGTSGTSGSSGISGTDGSSGISGSSGTSGSSGSSGVDGTSGTSGSSGISGSSGTSGTSGSSGSSGSSGISGSSGTSGTSGSSGSSGSSGISGTDGSSGTSGISGTSGTSGSSGSSGVDGTSGTSGSSGISGSSGTSGIDGSSGTSGSSGSSGSSGIDGSSGTSGTSGLPGISSIVRITTGITIDETFAGKIIEADGTFTINFPDNLPIGTKVDVVNIGRGIITLTATSLLSDGDRLETQYSAASLYFRGNRTWVAVGELTNDPDFKYFVTEWYVSGDDDGRTVMLPLPDFGEYNATVDWGDGTPVQNITAYNVNNTHTYTNAGTYYIKISGHCTGWYFSHVGHSRYKIRSVKYWGTSDGFSGFTYLNFNSCYNLRSTGRGKILPYGNVYDLAEVFYSCRSLTGVTSGIFDLYTEVIYNAFLGSFYGCYELEFIPDDLFKYNTYAYSFEGTFERCDKLRTIPDGLFAFNRAVMNFQCVFNQCARLICNPKTFYLSDSDRATRFLNKSVDFSDAFNIGYWMGNQKGTAPDLWNCDFGTGNPIKTNCFRGHSANSLTNYNDIPTDWR